MELTLPKSVLGSLPAPDEEGLVRVMVTMRVDSENGTANVEQIGGKPVGDEKDDTDPAAAADQPTDDAAPMPEAPALDPSKMY